MTARSKGQKRLETILRQIPAAREQLLAAIDDLGPELDVAAIEAAATSADPRERNKVAVIERGLDVLIAYLEELATRGLAEAQRTGSIPPSQSQGVGRLAELDVISDAAALRLRDIKDIRDTFAHAYPPASWRGLQEAVHLLLRELDSYTVAVTDWLRSTDVIGD
jgi:hypothetical protein